MEIKEVVEAWQKGELTGEAAMCVIHNILYPGVIDQEDIDWALSNCGGREPRPGSGFKPHELQNILRWKIGSQFKRQHDRDVCYNTLREEHEDCEWTINDQTSIINNINNSSFSSNLMDS